MRRDMLEVSMHVRCFNARKPHACAQGIVMREEPVDLAGKPARISKILDVPDAWRFIGYFCLGYPMTQNDSPELERAGWEQRRDPATFITRR